jgi:predicted RNase H-like HicB family nuclease
MSVFIKGTTTLSGKRAMTRGNFNARNDLIYACRLIIVWAMNGMSEYCKDALKLAVVKNLGAGEGFSAKIPGFAGLVVFAPTRAEVMTELKSALEGWIELFLECGKGDVSVDEPLPS